MTEQDARTVAEEQFGVFPLSVTPLPFGHNSVSFDVTLPSRSVIVRMNRDAEVFAGTERNLSILRDLGLPVSTVVAVDRSLTRRPFAWMIVDKIPGRDLRYEIAGMTRDQMSRLAEQIVSFQRLVATLPDGEAHGYVPIGEKGPFSTWTEKIEDELVEIHEWLPRLDDPQLRAFATETLRQVEAERPYLDAVPPTCFLDDVTTKNVIVQNGELQGLVDFDVVCYGDPLFQVGLTATAVVSDVGLDELFYVEELLRLWPAGPPERRIFQLYATICSLYFIRNVAIVVTPAWNSRMRTALDAWVGGE